MAINLGLLKYLADSSVPPVYSEPPSEVPMPSPDGDGYYFRGACDILCEFIREQIETECCARVRYWRQQYIKAKSKSERAYRRYRAYHERSPTGLELAPEVPFAPGIYGPDGVVYEDYVIRWNKDFWQRERYILSCVQEAEEDAGGNLCCCCLMHDIETCIMQRCIQECRYDFHDPRCTSICGLFK